MGSSGPCIPSGGRNGTIGARRRGGTRIAVARRVLGRMVAVAPPPLLLLLLRTRCSIAAPWWWTGARGSVSAGGVARRRGVDGGGGGGRVPSGILAGGERGRRLYNGGGWGRRGLRAVGDVGIRRGGEWDRVAERHGTAGGEEVGVEGLDASIPSHPARQRAALDFLSGFHGRTTTTEALTCGHRRRGGGGRGLRALGWRCIVVAG